MPADNTTPEFPNASDDAIAEAWLDKNEPRLAELLSRLVSVGNPYSKFSASEFHELYEGVLKLVERLWPHKEAVSPVTENPKEDAFYEKAEAFDNPLPVHQGRNEKDE